MITKNIVSISVILTLLIFPAAAFGSVLAHEAIPAVSEEPTGELATAASPADELNLTATGISLTAPPAGAVYPVHSPRLYKRYSPESVIYRNNYDQPIRDFRYYKVKANPNQLTQRKNVPLRDFRFDYWRNKFYR